MGIKGRFNTRSMTFPRYMLLTTPQKRSGWSLRRSGPGVTPWMRKAPNSTDRLTFGGIPSVRSGMKEEEAAELFADSGAATPSMAPVPNFWGSFETLFSRPYDMNDARTGPPPGRMPRKKPTRVPRTRAHFD